jgi:DNA-binding beta-propeller fold protein YncE
LIIAAKRGLRYADQEGAIPVRSITIAVLIWAISATFQPAPEPLHAAGIIPMPAVEGRIDHLAVDVAGKRLFVAALGNNTVEVIDISAMRGTKSITGLHEPQGIRFVPDRNRVVVANGGDGSTVFYDGTSLSAVHTAKTSGDADNVRYDPKASRVYVGYGDGALGAFDPDGKPLGNIKLAAHPESFQLESAGPRIFVNVPSAGHVAVVDRDKQSVSATWRVTAAGANYPMGLDEPNHRLFLGCRRPAKLLVYDTASGNLVTSIDIVGDTDDLFYDPAKKRLYVIGGEGFITVLEQQDADHYRQLQKIPTSAGARTGLFVPELGKLFLAVPHRGAQRAEIRVYDT